MKKSDFKINVWDLLLSAGKQDQISFEDIYVDEITSLTKKWISGNVVIQSFDQDSLLVTLEDLKCTLHEPCDKCAEEYDRKINIKEYSAKFQNEVNPEEEWDDEIFLIDGNENIDIKDMVIQAIVLQEPFKKLCSKCQKISKKEENEEDIDYFESTGNITFS